VRRDLNESIARAVIREVPLMGPGVVGTATPTSDGTATKIPEEPAGPTAVSAATTAAARCVWQAVIVGPIATATAKSTMTTGVRGAKGTPALAAESSKRGLKSRRGEGGLFRDFDPGGKERKRVRAGEEEEQRVLSGEGLNRLLHRLAAPAGVGPVRTRSRRLAEAERQSKRSWHTRSTAGKALRAW
jgi:hypothetical protein